MRTYSSTPSVAPDHVVRAAINRARVWLTDGVAPVEAVFRTWTRTAGTGQLAAICVNPLTNRRWLVGLDNRSNRVRVLAPAR